MGGGRYSLHVVKSLAAKCIHCIGLQHDMTAAADTNAHQCHHMQSSYTSQMHERLFRSFWLGGGGTGQNVRTQGGGSAKAYTLQQGWEGVKNGRFRAYVLYGCCPTTFTQERAKFCKLSAHTSAKSNMYGCKLDLLLVNTNRHITRASTTTRVSTVIVFFVNGHNLIVTPCQDKPLRLRQHNLNQPSNLCCVAKNFMSKSNQLMNTLLWPQPIYNH